MTAREPVVAFVGDGEYPLALGPAEIVELERKCGSGIGAIAKRLFAGQFSHADLAETIRLALIGGGETPKNAAAISETYVAGRPISETYETAVLILDAVWFGRLPASQEGEGA
ncbi:MAG: gene transfer agent family protein [Salinarimonas sp.]